ncbi:cation:proton antiporter [Mucilaginibacter auburnensis]|uniref:NhaP-type Na+/H+ or K+/H+ antiporter n=1 Tax=Mucilaginibacter auburnensis TaxID=1457233 RepID=A0A2H9VS59_9SPHI|nr:sodium:proton antiporter [Mucilaginibacter auburnensis]PJJ83655.1 NhaP-type Na+/H+ or K+/H+ antiporter [Mucilaginibacter auburnensis]
MTVGIILTLCILVLLAYVFDFTSAKTKIPSVILLLGLGYLVKQLCYAFNIILFDLSGMLPILGTIGLILIVLEGSLELELNSEKLPLIRKSVWVAFLPIILISFGVALTMHYQFGYDLRRALANAIPLAIISSSIAIPSTRNFTAEQREFVIYESSISDILGVIFFNFITQHTSFGLLSFGMFFAELIIIILISFVATGALSFMLSRLQHHVKFVPIMFLVILIYEISKVFHLPSLVFILVFGLFLNNLDKLRHIAFIQKLKPKVLRVEVHKFKELTIEATFLVRALFFLLFGFLIETRELIATDTLAWSVGITAGIFLIRAVVLKLAKMPLMPLVFVAPRGLITILLFLSLPLAFRIPLINRPMIIQVIVLSALVLMVGALLNKRPVTEEEPSEYPA